MQGFVHRCRQAASVTAVAAEVVRTGMLTIWPFAASCLFCHILTLATGVSTVLRITPSQEVHFEYTLHLVHLFEFC